MRKVKSDDQFEVLRKIDKKPQTSQREMAQELGFSLGKLNYCLQALKDKGLVKIKNFQKKTDKVAYFQYVITPKRISERTKITINFMKRKMREYDELKKEIIDLQEKYKFLKDLKLIQNLVGSPPANKFKKNQTFKTNAVIIKRF